MRLPKESQGVLRGAAYSYRVLRCLTQAGLAARLGVTRLTYERFENGRGNLSAVNAEALGRIVSGETVAAGDGERAGLMMLGWWGELPEGWTGRDVWEAGLAAAREDAAREALEVVPFDRARRRAG